MSRVASEDRDAPGFAGEAGVSFPVGCTRCGKQATLLLGPDTVGFFFFLCARGEPALLAPAATDISVTKEGSVS